MTTTILITREILYRTLRAAAPFASQDGTRFHLCGVHVEVEGGRGPVHFVATDGHTLADARPLCETSGGVGAATTLPSDAVATLIKRLKPCKANAEDRVVLAIAPNGNVTVAGPGLGELMFAPILDRDNKPAKFPPWRAVMTEPRPYPDVSFGAKKVKGDGVTAICFGPPYMLRACEAARYFGLEAGAARGFKMSVPPSALDLIRLDVDVADVGSLTVGIMPMRG